mgnify:CR=1 FL=1
MGSVSKYIPMRGCTDEASSDALVDGIIKIESALQPLSSTTDGVLTWLVNQDESVRVLKLKHREKFIISSRHFFTRSIDSCSPLQTF